MKVTQVYEIANTMTKEMLGESVVLNEDLSNIVDVGKQFESVAGLDNYVKKLVDHIGRMVFVDRVYSGRAPSVLMDGWEYGSIMEKVSADIPEATENESWELVDGASYDPNIFYKPSVNAKFWNGKVTFEVDRSVAERQVMSSFSNPTQLNSFFSMLYNAVTNGMNIKRDALIMRTINNLMAETLYSDYKGTAFNSKSGVKAVNLLKLYNDKYGEQLTAEKAVTTPEFIRFAVFTMTNYIDRMSVMSTAFNIDGKARFTPRDMLHVVLWSEFKNAANVYLQSDTFNEQYTALPNADSVPFWQGNGGDYSFNSCTTIDVKTASSDGTSHTVKASGILGVMWDRDALGVACADPRVTTQYVAKAEFFNYFHKWDANYFNDTAENMVVFFVA